MYILTIYIFTYQIILSDIIIFVNLINIYLYGVYGSVGQPKASKLIVPGSNPGSSCFYLVFINNLIK